MMRASLYDLYDYSKIAVSIYNRVIHINEISHVLWSERQIDPGHVTWRMLRYPII